MEHYFSSGKLLITSEYVVLDGAKALALPTKMGQDLWVEEKEDNNAKIFWETYHQNELWLSIEIDYRRWEIISTNLKPNAFFILKVLRYLQSISLEKFKKGVSYHIKTNLHFPANYGLGSSSTLMANLAKWAKADAFLLNEKTLGGSGYDVAVALEEKSILYQLKPFREVVPVHFSPKFKDDLLFVHLNQKQDSREGIALYKTREKSKKNIDFFLELTDAVLEADSLAEFSKLMKVHEQKLSEFLGIPTVRELYFSDYPGFIKSLGAWGGDFIMAENFSRAETYFREKGFSDIFNFSDIIL
ncbi:GYDIA family GHMP kinase [Riemerella anatipestifer]|uniref:GYDIA family GHMP kinase n=1 Tax=Riemerella anatipestifer TaxID=34085 RepID=UPI002096DAD5|nr:GYDIA family GHMP kinase [Riemerella anatipestifer]MCO7332239.1 GYDIA family GHMP kinase [Riemerella anatipestifer]MCO7351128.1 GYDIA family GHMP kinase [Riemerella anatipestifer]